MGRRHPRFVDFTGQTVGVQTAIRYLGSRGSKSLWEVRCECGAVREMPSSEFSRGHSCGCKTPERVSAATSTHRMTNHPAYVTWRSMKARCGNPKHPYFHLYGGRGIAVCKKWWDSFEAFWADMGPTYFEGAEIDRKNNNRGYSKGNCRWTSRRGNMRNTRANRVIDTPKGPMLVCEAADVSGIGQTTLLYRLAAKWPTERLFDPPSPSNRFTTLKTRGRGAGSRS